MTHLLVVAHEPLASALQALAGHVFAETPLAAVDVPARASLDDTAAQVRAALAPALARGEDALVLVDVFGATPCNAALAAAEGTRVRIVAGVNVPMLWRTLGYASLPLDELVARALAGASQGVMHVSVPRRQNQAPSVHTGVSHDPQHHHHQQ